MKLQQSWLNLSFSGQVFTFCSTRQQEYPEAGWHCMTCGDISKLSLLPFFFRITSGLFPVQSIPAKNKEGEIDEWVKCWKVKICFDCYLLPFGTEFSDGSSSTDIKKSVSKSAKTHFQRPSIASIECKSLLIFSAKIRKCIWTFYSFFFFLSSLLNKMDF